MKPHKWAKEIKAWADGAEIEMYMHDKWTGIDIPQWHQDNDYRIKPQPKEDDVNDSLKDFIKSQSDNIKAQQDTIKGYQELIQMLNARLEKPQPKEPQYLYVYAKLGWTQIELHRDYKEGENAELHRREYIGKIKLETDDEG